MSNKRFILVTGPESTGSRLIARTIATAIGICNFEEWDGHGDRKSETDFVMHRSLPHNDPPNWIDIDEIKNGVAKDYTFYVIFCTRDIHIIARSKVFRFIKSNKVIQLEARNAKTIISDHLNNNSFIWSYETFMYLKEAYLQRLYQFLDIKSEFMPSIEDGNQKYIKDFPSFIDRVKIFIKRIGA